MLSGAGSDGAETKEFCASSRMMGHSHICGTALVFVIAAARACRNMASVFVCGWHRRPGKVFLSSADAVPAMLTKHAINPINEEMRRVVMVFPFTNEHWVCASSRNALTVLPVLAGPVCDMPPSRSTCTMPWLIAIRDVSQWCSSGARCAAI